MEYKAHRKCAHCGARFRIQSPKHRYCSALCLIEYRSTRQGDCLLWGRERDWLGMQITYQKRNWPARQLSWWAHNGETGTVPNTLYPTCGNPKCIAPEHMTETRPERPRRKRRLLTQAEVLDIARSREPAWLCAERTGFNICTVQSIRAGRRYSELTGIQPKDKKDAE